MKTIFTLSIECVWGAYLKERFHRLVEVPCDMSLGDLHRFMQELTGFDDDHPSTFYMANTWRGKRKHLMENEEWEINDPMWTKTLKQIFPLGPHKKLYYWFDFGDDWTFEIRKRGKESQSRRGTKYPRVIAEDGPKPVQYPSFEE
ncbi:MAG TPA: hypothetical protein VJB15_09795 [Rhodothermia bacterium]|nr:hypothetical protein [Rhodothermia bacterium]